MQLQDVLFLLSHWSLWRNTSFFNLNVLPIVIFSFIISALYMSYFIIFFLFQSDKAIILYCFTNYLFIYILFCLLKMVLPFKFYLELLFVSVLLYFL